MHQIAGLQAWVPGDQVARGLDVHLVDRPDFVNAVFHQAEGVFQIAQSLISKIEVKELLKHLRRRCESDATLHEMFQHGSCLLAQPMLAAQIVDEHIGVDEDHVVSKPAILDSAMIRLASGQSISRAPGG